MLLLCLSSDRLWCLQQHHPWIADILLVGNFKNYLKFPLLCALFQWWMLNALTLWAEELGDLFTLMGAHCVEELAYIWSPALSISTSRVVVRNRTISTSDVHRTGPGKEADLLTCLLCIIAGAHIQHSGCKTQFSKKKGGSVSMRAIEVGQMVVSVAVKIFPGDRNALQKT